MGGHAFSAYNGLSTIIADFGVLTTGGGDNVVLAQQAAKGIVSAYQAMARTDRCVPGRNGVV